MTNINYLTCVDIKRKNNIQDINNATVKSFYKATLCDENYYSDISCPITKELLIEELQEEIQTRKDNGSPNLTKLILKECLPEFADFISVSTHTSQRIVNINEVVNVRENKTHSKEDLELHRSNRKKKVSESKKINTLQKWVC